ncbi:MAG: S9 family peptidase [Alphaproteobacteria bacterium]|nr:S9 family peptidase [Alphaproteobacteria bacterium]
MPFSLPPHAPVAAKKPVTDTRHGITRTDVYDWLRDPHWQELMKDPAVLQPDIRAYLEAENAYADQAMQALGPLREQLFQEIKGRIKEDDSSVPSPHGDWLYYTRYETGAQHPLFCRKPRHGGEETIILDGNKEAEPHAYFKIGGAARSHDDRLFAWSADLKGSEYFGIRVRDMTSGSELADLVPDTSGGIVWTLDNQSFYYVKVDENHRPAHVFRHRLGTDALEDECVYHESDPSFFVSVGATQSGRYILINVHDHQTSEVHLIDAADPDAHPRLVEPRLPGIEYDLEHDARGDRFLIVTNADDAEDFKLVEAPIATPGRRFWRDLVAHRPGILVLGQIAFHDFHVRSEREDGLTRLVVRRMSDGQEQPISFDETAYDLSLMGSLEYETHICRFSYSSMTTPEQVFDYDMASGERTLLKEQEVPSGHDASDYVTERVFAVAADGERVPISLLYRKGLQKDGTAPCLLYGYGSYGISIPASFSVSRLSLVDRGFVYAIAHIRGGQERGYRWYTQGRLLNKMNTFTDFIAAGEHLAEAGYTSRGEITAHGGSAGGMLMGAVANLSPSLFKGLIAEVAFVDVLNTILDETLPLTPPEWLEWGNPIEDKDAYEMIASYSPYDNVRRQAYPHIFALAGLTDPRVTYWEPAKWIAKLREFSTSDNALFLKTNMSAGHGGASGRFERLKETAMVYAFALAIHGRA